MDPLGFSISVVGLAGQLFKVGLQWYDILSETEGFGTDHDRFFWQIRTERNRLVGWEETWGLHSGLNQKLDPDDYRYRYAVGTLARIVSLFASADSLWRDYGIQAMEKPSRLSRRVTFPRQKATRETNSSIPTPLTSLNSFGVKALKNPSVLENKNLVPGLAEEIACLSETTARLQQALPFYRKLRWVVADRKKAGELIRQLKQYNDGLFAVLPTLPQSTGCSSLSFSKFDVPMRLPVQRNKSFCGRDDLLEKLHRILKPEVEVMNISGKQIQLLPGRRIAVLHGLGGMGKSQIAAEYAYRHSVGSLYTSAFWIDATSQASLAQSALGMAEQIVSHYITKWGDSRPNFAEIGIMLGLPGFVGPTGEIKPDAHSSDSVLRAMGKWLSDAGNRNWLVVFDNNDDIDSVKLCDFFPICDFGSIIVTTRRPEIKCFGDGIEVENIEETAGISILLRSSGRSGVKRGDADYAEAAKIAKRLGYLPLALDQAGGYISTKQIPLSGYLPLYGTKFKDVVSRSNQRLVESYRNDTVFTTWKISFDSLPKLASELLLLCAFLGNGKIPGELLYRGREVIPQLFQDGDLADDAIEPLLLLSLAKRKGFTLPGTLSFHPLVLEWARESQDMLGRRKYSSQAINLVGATYKVNKKGVRTMGDWAFGLRILTHIDISLHNIRALHSIGDAFGSSAACVLEKIACYCRDHGRYEEEEEILQMALAICRKNSTSEELTPQITRIMSEIGWVHIHRSRYWEALGLFEQVLSSRQKSLGMEHQETLRASHGMASALYWLRKYKKAVELYKQVLTSYERTLGADHHDTLRCAHNIGLCLQGLGRYEEATKLCEKVLAIREKMLGKEHPLTLITNYGIITALRGLGRYDEAVELYKSLLASQGKALGREHPDTLVTADNMALTLHGLRRYDEAAELYTQVLASRERTLGKEHLATLATAHNMAFALHHLGRYEEAVELYKPVLVSREKAIGKQHADTLSTAHNMALSIQELRKQKGSMKMGKQTLANGENIFGEGYLSIILLLSLCFLVCLCV